MSILLLPVCSALGLTACNALVEAGASWGDMPTQRKHVLEKSPPDILRAADGTECVVPPARFDSIDPGDEVSCVWVDELDDEVDRRR